MSGRQQGKVEAFACLLELTRLAKFEHILKAPIDLPGFHQLRGGLA